MATQSQIRSPQKKKQLPASASLFPKTGTTSTSALAGQGRKRKGNTPQQPSPNLNTVFEQHQDAENAQPRRKKAKKEDQQQQPFGGVAQPKEVRPETLEWRRRYKKAFRCFVFYFDHLGAAKSTDLTKVVLQLGATVENFFSNKVTHIISSRAATLDKENAGKQSKSAATKPVAKSPENKNPFIDDNFLAKAQNLGVKIWSLEKAHKVLTELLDGNSPTKPAASKNPSLPHLLRAEALSGITYERDPDVDRPDYYYFPQRSYHLLVEDATGEHRTVIAKEYERPRRGDAAEWPILFGGVEGRPAFGSREQAVPPLPKQQQQQQMQAQQRKKAQKAAAKAGNVPLAAKTTNPMLAPPAPPAVGGGLRRSASVNSFNKRLAEVMVNDLRHQGAGNDSTAVGDTSANEVSAIKTHAERAQEQDVDEYVAASGNSQPVTSNIASVTSGAPLSNANGTHNNARACAGVMLDARLAQLNKRQVLVNKIGLSGQQTLQHRMLKEKPVPGKLAAARQRISAVQEGLKNSNPARPNEPAKPGYCENCRVRYDDFKEHIDSRRHRKFALDANNWADLDSLLFDVARPVLPEYRKAPIESDEDEDSDNQSGEEENSERSYEDADEDTRYIRAVDEDEDEEQERSDAEADSDQDKFRTLGTGVDRAECFVCEDKCVCLCRDGLCSHDNSSECDF